MNVFFEEINQVLRNGQRVKSLTVKCLCLPIKLIRNKIKSLLYLIKRNYSAYEFHRFTLHPYLPPFFFFAGTPTVANTAPQYYIMQNISADNQFVALESFRQWNYALFSFVPLQPKTKAYFTMQNDSIPDMLHTSSQQGGNNLIRASGTHVHGMQDEALQKPDRSLIEA